MPDMMAGLTEAYRLKRSLRVIRVDEATVSDSLANFDAVVGEIEESVWRETTSGQLTASWQPHPRDETCTACDAKTFCPAIGNQYRGAPLAP